MTTSTQTAVRIEAIEKHIAELREDIAHLEMMNASRNIEEDANDDRIAQLNVEIEDLIDEILELQAHE